MTLEQTISVLYKEQSSKIMASLLRIFGQHNFDLVEDIMHDAFNIALTNWQENGIPNNPSAWLIQTAKHKALDIIRSQKNKLKLSEQLNHYLKSEWTISHTVDESFDEYFIKDEQLRMIFMCCNPEIQPKNQIPFILKVLCGFSNTAISNALLLPKETIKKRLVRTKLQFKKLPNILATILPDNEKFNLTVEQNSFSSENALDQEHYQQAIHSVHTVLYLLFNEGFHSSEHTVAIKKHFCLEATALLKLVVEQPILANKQTYALYALMHFHIARIDTRLDDEGGLIPLNLQDRSKWSPEHISKATYFLLKAKNYGHTQVMPENMSLLSKTSNERFFIEASIAEQHCISKTFKDTDWPTIVSFYQHLLVQTGTEITEVNYAIALGYAGNIDKAMAIMLKLSSSKQLAKTHIVEATMAHLSALSGKKEQAYAYAKASIEKGGTVREIQLMMQQITRLLKD